jgi:hypothetical protein
VVQQASGNLVWEAGDLNRIVSIPEDAPVGSMLTSVCAFNIIDGSAETKLKPVTADVLELLEASLEEEKAQEEARAAAAEAAAAVEAEKTRLAGAAAAVAKALATMGECWDWQRVQANVPRGTSKVMHAFATLDSVRVTNQLGPDVHLSKTIMDTVDGVM